MLFKHVLVMLSLSPVNGVGILNDVSIVVVVFEWVLVNVFLKPHAIHAERNPRTTADFHTCFSD